MRWKALVVIALSLAAPVQAGTRTLPRDGILVEPQGAASRVVPQAKVEAVLASVARSDADHAIALLFGEEDPQRFEPLAARVVESLRGQPPTAASLRVLEALAQSPLRLYRRHDETAGDWFVPLYDVPGRAGAALQGFERLRQRDLLRRALQRDALATLTASSADPALLAEAITQLDPKTIAALAPQALARPAEVTPVAWAALARRHPAPDLLQAALAYAPAVDIPPLLQELVPRLPGNTALAWLDAALAQPDYASAAVLALGTLAPRSAAADAKLVALLASPQHGASAAAALARDPRPDRVARIGKRLAVSRDPVELGHLALALRLEGSAAALQQLQRLAEDPRLSAAARAELQR